VQNGVVSKKPTNKLETRGAAERRDPVQDGGAPQAAQTPHQVIILQKYNNAPHIYFLSPKGFKSTRCRAGEANSHANPRHLRQEENSLKQGFASRRSYSRASLFHFKLFYPFLEHLQPGRMNIKCH